MDKTDLAIALTLSVAIWLSFNTRFADKGEPYNDLLLKMLSYQLDIIEDTNKLAQVLRHKSTVDPFKIAAEKLKTALEKNMTPPESIIKEFEDANDVLEALNTDLTNIKQIQKKQELVQDEMLERAICVADAFWELVVLNTLARSYKNPGWKKMAFLLLSPYIKSLLMYSDLDLFPKMGTLNFLEYYKRYHRVDSGQLAFLMNYFKVPLFATDCLSFALHYTIVEWWFRYLKVKVKISRALRWLAAAIKRGIRSLLESCKDCLLWMVHMLVYFLIRTNRQAARLVSRLTTVYKKPITARLLKDQDGFFHACLYGHKEIVLAILADSDTALEIDNVEQFTGQTAFHLACIKGHLSIVHNLINKFGAEVCSDLKNRDELTGLEVAAEHGRSEIVHALLRSVPRKQLRKPEGMLRVRSALKLSIENDHYESAKKIYSHLGDSKIISNEPYFDVYFKRFYDISSYLVNHSLSKNIKELKHRQKQVANKDIYKNYMSYILKENSKDHQATAPAQPSPDEEDLDCPVCFEFMCKPRSIFSCFNGHLLCSVCLACPKIQSCPLCRDDFKARKPKRNLAAEDKAKELENTIKI